jgi:hypothetical protein
VLLALLQFLYLAASMFEIANTPAGLVVRNPHRTSSLLDTLPGFKSLAETTSERNIIWLNEYFGIIERDGKRFGEMTALLENEAKVFGSVRLIRQDPDTFGRDGVGAGDVDARLCPRSGKHFTSSQSVPGTAASCVS